MMSMKFDYQLLSEKWKSPIVARSAIGIFTGGLISPRTIANRDSQGIGPAGKYRCGGKVFYTVDSLISWLGEQRSKL